MLADHFGTTREATLALVGKLDRADLHRQVDPLLSPLVWDLGHIAAYEDLWCAHRLTGAPLLRPELAVTYDAFETPRQERGDVELLDYEASLDYMDSVRDRTLAILADHGEHEVHEMVLRHELQHVETMRQALYLGGLPGGAPDPVTAPAIPDEAEWVEIPAGPFAMGAGGDGFAFDNERPHRQVDVPAFQISRWPVSGGTFLTFAEGGGFERREWWSDEGWAWKECYDNVGCPGRDAPHNPVLHVTWFEAEAFARSQGARLPTEAEWEKAATWEHGTALEAVGHQWEWTATEFTGYPGFVAHPYPEYSEVFFDRGYKVLRGGSWASSPRVATPTFRNWDWPARRQIFNGIRLAKDV